MVSSLVFLGYVVDNKKVIGAKLSDVIKGESNLISIESFRNGVKNGIKILNVSSNGNDIIFKDGINTYSLYDKKGSIKRLGSKILVEFDNGSWYLVEQDGKVSKAIDLDILNRVYKDLVKIPNQARLKKAKEIEVKEEDIPRKAKAVTENIYNDINKYEGMTDLDILNRLFKSLTKIDYRYEIGKHIVTRSLRSLSGEIETGRFKFVLEKSNFVLYYYNGARDNWYKSRSYIKFKVKTIAAMTLHREGALNRELVLLSENLYDGSGDFLFNGILLNENFYSLKFNLSHIIYVRNIENWCGNRDVLDGLKKSKLSQFSDDNNIEMVIAIKYNDGARLVVVSSRPQDRNKTVGPEYVFNYIDLNNFYNFPRNGSVLNTIVSYMTDYKDNIKLPDNKILNTFSKLDHIRERYRPNLDNVIEYMPLEAVDRTDKNLYEEVFLNTKDKVSVYSAREDAMMILHTGLKKYNIMNLYKNEVDECNILYNSKYNNENEADKGRLSAIKDVAYTSLTENEFNDLVSSLHKNSVYTNMPLSKNAYIHKKMVVQTIRYCIVINGEAVHAYIDKHHNLALLELSDLLTRNDKKGIIDRYRGMLGMNSMVYLIYKVVLEYDKTIPRCNEQLMYNGEIEDILDSLIISKNIDEKNDRVTLYIDRYRVEMQLSLAKEKLKEIYDKYKDMTEGNSSKKLGIMKVAAGINSMNGRLIFNESVRNKNIVVPDVIEALYIETEKELEVNKLTLVDNVKLDFKTYGTLKVKNLELKDKANNMIQKYSKSNNRLIYQNCKINDLNITGRTLYDLVLTMLYINDTFIKDRYIRNPYMDQVGSREKNIALYVYINLDKPDKTHLVNLLENVHKIYELSLSDKSILSLLKYIETLTDRKKFEAVTKCDDPDIVGKYITIIGILLKSYDFNEYCCNEIIKVGKCIQDQVIKLRL